MTPIQYPPDESEFSEEWKSDQVKVNPMTDVKELVERVTWLAKNAEEIENAVSYLHRARADVASEWMRDDDRKFRCDLQKHLAHMSEVKSALTALSGENERMRQALLNIIKQDQKVTGTTSEDAWEHDGPFATIARAALEPPTS